MVSQQLLLGSCRVVALILVLAGGRQVRAAETLLLDFSSATCSPCQQMRPTVQRLAAAGYQIRHVDIGHERELAAQYHVDQVPTFIALVDGREVARIVGSAGYEQLQEMLTPRGETTLRGQSPDAGFASVGTPTAPPATLASSQIPPATFSPEPFSSETQQPTHSPFAAGPSTSSPIDPALLLEATVKVAVDDADGTSAGTGTMIDAREGATLILTCGHLFRTSEGKGPVTVTLYSATPQGAQVRETVPGQLFHYDLDRDLAFIIIRPQSAVRIRPIAPANTLLAPGIPVTTVGCNHGENPTAIPSQVTTIDRYQGAPNVQVAGAPVEGRSGGGLFNASGQLIGVCFAADPQANEGLYASWRSIQQKLDELKLAMVYESPQGIAVASDSGPAQLVAAQSGSPVPQSMPGDQSVEIRGQDAVAANEPSPSSFTTGAAQVSQSLSSDEQVALEEIHRRGLNSEVICIIRPLDPAGKSEVITLNSVSPQFVGALAREHNSATTSESSSPATAAAGQLLR